MRIIGNGFIFDTTGIDEIDKILSAVACASNSFNDTRDWGFPAESFTAHVGDNPADWIQNAANDAAKLLKEIQ